MSIEYLKRIKINNRKAVITTENIQANTPICEFFGEHYSFDELSKLQNADDALQIGPNLYLGYSGNITDKIRHSCNANCRIVTAGSRAILYSLYFIKANSEITYDYSLTSSEAPDTWNMVCNCKSINCRKNISGFYNMDKEDQKAKISLAALYIRRPNFYVHK